MRLPILKDDYNIASGTNPANYMDHLALTNQSSLILADASASFYPYLSTVQPDFTLTMLSMSADLAVLAILCLIRFYRHPLNTMVFFLMLSDFFVYLSYLLAEIIQPSSLFQCKALSYIFFTGRNASLCWAVLFSHALLKIIETNDFDLVKRLMKYYIAIAVFVPLILSTANVPTSLVIYDEDRQTAVWTLWICKFI